MKALAWIGACVLVLATYVAWENFSEWRTRERDKATMRTVHAIAERLSERLDRGETLPVGEAVGPDRDGWGEPIRIVTRARSFVVVSNGADRSPDAVRVSGQHPDRARDVVLANGYPWSQHEGYASVPVAAVERWSFDELLDHDYDEVRALVSVRGR